MMDASVMASTPHVRQVPPDDAPLRGEEATDSTAPAGTSTAALRRSAWWRLRTAAITISIFVGYQLLLIVHSWVSAVLTVILYIVFGAVIGFLLSPVTDALERHARFPRTLAALTSILLLLAVIAGLVYLVAGPLISEARTLSSNVPGYLDRGNHLINQLRQQLDQRGIHLGGGGLSAGDPSQLASRGVSLLVTGITGTLNVVLDLIVTVVVAFWLLKDGEKLRTGFLTLMPGRLQGDTAFALDAVGVVIGGYVRAQLFMAFLIGVLAGVGCAIIGVPFPIVVALAAGIFELVPLVGPFLGGAVAILLAFTVSPVLALGALILFLGIHVVEGYVLAPRIQARFVRLHPLIALLALFAGIEVAGFLGALFAVPLASLAAVFVRSIIGDVRAHHPDLYAARQPDMYLERRRSRLLGEFRLFHRPVGEVLRDAAPARWRGRRR